MKDSIGNHVDHLTQDTSEAVQKSIEYYKVTLLKKAAISLLLGSQFVIKVGIIVLALFFISIGLAFLIGNQLGTVSYGFFIIGGVYGILLIVMALFGKTLLEKPIFKLLNKILHSNSTLQNGFKSELTDPKSSNT